MIAIAFFFPFALRAHAAVDLLRQARIDRIGEVPDVVFDVGYLDVFASEVTGIDDLQEIVQDLNDGTFVRKGSRCEMLELRMQGPERLQQFARDVANLIPFFQMLVHFTRASSPTPSEPRP